MIYRWLVGLLFLHGTMLAYGAWIHGPGWDEVGHLPAGISHWQLGNTDLYRVNPPLARMVATIPLAFMDWDIQWAWSGEETRHRPEWELGRQLWRKYDRDIYWYLTIARWMSIPWSLLAAFMVYRWGKELYGEQAGFFSAVLWCCSPLVLTNAQMMTPDTCAASLGVCATYSFWKWLHAPDLSSTYNAGLLLGLAELSKFTWVVLFVLWPTLWCVEVLRTRSYRQRRLVFKHAGMLVLIIGLAVLVVNVGYGFQGSFKRLGDYFFVSESLRHDGEKKNEPENRWAGSLLGEVPIPFPSNYVLGIDRQKLDFESNFQSYFRGEWRDRGWWYYYVYGLVVKEPLGYLVLFGLTVAISVRRGIGWHECVMLAPGVLVLALVSSQTGFNHHVRYVLPTLPFVFLWMGKVWTWSVKDHKLKMLTIGLLMSSILASFWVFPHSHAYFNVFAGGPRHGHDHLLDSNIDWGQDILLLSHWVQLHPDKPLDGIAYSLDWLLNYEALGLPVEKPPSGYRGVQPVSELTRNKFGPQPGRYAVFVRPLREADHQYEYFLFFEPVEILGYTVYIYEIDEDDVSRYWGRND